MNPSIFSTLAARVAELKQLKKQLETQNTIDTTFALCIFAMKYPTVQKRIEIILVRKYEGRVFHYRVERLILRRERMRRRLSKGELGKILHYYSVALTLILVTNKLQSSPAFSRSSRFDLIDFECHLPIIYRRLQDLSTMEFFLCYRSLITYHFIQIVDGK